MGFSEQGFIGFINMPDRRDINILLTNDDGVYAEGLLALKSALERVGSVHIVAPDRPRSASGHAITLHKPLRVDEVTLPDGTKAYSSSGTPSDCVSLGLLELVKAKVDLVVSGINRGPNLGWDLTYSGTVSAAMEAVIAGIPAIAVSIASYKDGISYDYAAGFAAYLAGLLLERKLPSDTLLNVNVPNLPPERIVGVKVTRQGRRRYVGRAEKRLDPNGRVYYWLGGTEAIDDLEEGTDVKAIADGMVSVTPVHLDLTSYAALHEIEQWGIEAYKPYFLFSDGVK